LDVANTEVEARANGQTGADEQERENESLDKTFHCGFVIEY